MWHTVMEMFTFGWIVWDNSLDNSLCNIASAEYIFILDSSIASLPLCTNINNNSHHLQCKARMSDEDRWILHIYIWWWSFYLIHCSDGRQLPVHQFQLWFSDAVQSWFIIAKGKARLRIRKALEIDRVRESCCDDECLLSEWITRLLMIKQRLLDDMR